MDERPQQRRLLCFASALNRESPCEKALLVIRFHMALLRKVARERQSAVIVVTHDERAVEGFDRVRRTKGGPLS